MPRGADDVDRLRAAVEAYERFVAEQGRRTAAEFLAEHEDLRDLLEPLIGTGKSQPNQSGERILGDFRLIGELGRGGMGVVYDAEQISLGRRVAVKVLPGSLALDPRRRARFMRESRLAASLDHPGIAKVISADVDGDVVWFAMERIDGAPLDVVLRRMVEARHSKMTGRWLESVVCEVARERGVESVSSHAGTHGPESEVWRRDFVGSIVRVGIQLSEALHHAHQNGVIHRDVKPANVLMRRDGSAVLTDFGLARELGASSLSGTGEYLGTPSYSAPEQLSGGHGRVDHRTDVYALGVTLYELLTRRRPFEATTFSELRTRILRVEPPLPRRLNPKISTDLGSVLLKALEKDPGQRYQSAATMGQDLRAVAEGRPVSAAPVRIHKRTWRWCRRNPWAATTIASLAGVVLLLLVVRGQLVRASESRAGTTLRSGVALARAGDFRGALDGLMLLEQEYPGAATDAALDELFRRYPCLASYPLTTHPGERVISAKFSSDGKWVLTLHEKMDQPEEVSWQLRLWRVPTPDPPSSQWSCEWSSESLPDKFVGAHVNPGPVVAWVKAQRTVAISGPHRTLSTIDCPSKIVGLFPSSVPGFFGVRLEDASLVYDTEGTVQQKWADRVALSGMTMMAVGDVLVGFKYDPTSTTLHQFSTDWRAIPVNIGVGKLRKSLDPDDPTRIVITTDEWVTAWRATSGRLHLEWKQRNLLPGRVLWPPLSRDELQSCNSELRAAGFGEFSNWLTNLVIGRYFSAESGEPYIVAIENQALRVWGVPEPLALYLERPTLELARYEESGRRIWCAGEETLTTIASDGRGLAAPEELEIPPPIRRALAGGMGTQVCGLAFDADRTIFACARRHSSQEGSPGLVWILPADELRQAKSYPCSITPDWIELSPDRKHLAVGGHNGRVELWEYDSLSRELSSRVTLPGHEVGAARLSCVRFLDTRYLIACEGSHRKPGQILRWDLNEPEAAPIPLAPSPPGRAVRSLAVSPGNELVAFGGDDQLVRVMRVVRRSGKPELEASWQREQGAQVLSVAFAERNGELLLASADRHGGVRLWDAATGADRGHVRDAASGEDEMILSLDFSPDGSHLAAAQSRGRVLIWDLDQPRRCLEGNRDCAEHLRRLRAESR